MCWNAAYIWSICLSHQLYKEEYSRRKKFRHMRHWEFPPVLPFMGPTVPDYPPAYPRCPPGFIGGDYDLYPNVAPGLCFVQNSIITDYSVWHENVVISNVIVLFLYPVNTLCYSTPCS